MLRPLDLVDDQVLFGFTLLGAFQDARPERDARAIREDGPCFPERFRPSARVEAAEVLLEFTQESFDNAFEDFSADACHLRELEDRRHGVRCPTGRVSLAHDLPWWSGRASLAHDPARVLLKFIQSQLATLEQLSVQLSEELGRAV